MLVLPCIFEKVHIYSKNVAEILADTVHTYA